MTRIKTHFAERTRFYDGTQNALALDAIELTDVPEPPSFPPGDYNRDGTVDGRDYVVWRNELGYVVPPCSGGDANCNGFVEWLDYWPWRDNWGRTVDGAATGATIGGTASVPEPASLVLAALTVLWLTRYRCK